jgi:hypothetical protein
MDQTLRDVSNNRNGTKGTHILCTDGHIGEVHDVLIDPTSSALTATLARYMTC